MQERRAVVLDTRPFLTCNKRMSTSSGGLEKCEGTEREPGWTENTGGSNFLIAFHKGSSEFQYPIATKALHTKNGPRLTEAVYTGTLSDGRFLMETRVSTWGGVTDFVRNIHSFR